MEMMEDVVIVGAGIAGLATAVALKRVGVRALVLERSEGLRATGAALTLFPNAWLALDALGVSHKLTPIYAPISMGYVTNVSAGDVQQVHVRVANNGSDGQGIRTIHRKALLEALAEELPVDSIQFSSKLAVIENEEQDGASIVVIHLEDGTTIRSKVLIGCDGVNSVVARWLGLAEPVHSGRSAVRGLAVFSQGHGFKQEVHQQPWGIIFGKLSKGNVTVAGDAMHPMTPDLGQGGGSSLEDAVVLGRHIGNSVINNGGLIVPGDMDKAIDDYVKERRWRAAFLVTGSYLVGWVQLGGDKWWVKFLRDGIFYKYLFGRMSGLVHKDCGKLPAMSSGDMDHSSKKD
ncbi:hypothetical protein D5086_032811 [Populus alba]|uniref:Uncharacterized protein n=1 Tax=Populus alba TaxID=43335 RepID=A0ACC4AF59_POPAL